MSRSRTGHNAFTGVFLVGLGVIALFNFWWPGVMFVIAAAILVSALVEGQLASHLLSVAIMLAIGIVGVVGKIHLSIGFSLWPLLFIAIGLIYLAQTFWKRKV